MNRYIITGSADRCQYGLQPWFNFDAELAKAIKGDLQARLKTHDTEDKQLRVIKQFYAKDWEAAKVVYEAAMKLDR